MVRNATTVAGVTSNSVTAYTPTVMMMSWITAMIAASAIRHSKRNVRYTAITKKNTTSALSALLLTLSPQVGPDVGDADLPRVDRPRTWRAPRSTFACSARLRSFDCTRTELLPEDEHLGVAEPERVDHVADVVDRDRPAAATVNCHCVPPSKSMPRLSPLISERDHRDQDQRPGEERPAPRPLDELEVGALVVEVGERVRRCRRSHGAVPSWSSRGHPGRRVETGGDADAAHRAPARAARHERRRAGA